MELKYHVLALGGGVILGIIGAIVARSFLVLFILPIGIYICAILWSKLNSIKEEEMPETSATKGVDNGVVDPKAVSDGPIQE